MVSVNYVNYQNLSQLSGNNNVHSAPSSLKNYENNNSNVKTNQFELPSFKAGSLTSTILVKTELTTDDEKEKYKVLYSALNPKYKKHLEYALKSGILLKNNSADKSSVLDNLYKIYTTPRDSGLDNLTILKESLDIIKNPFVITQTAEDIPKDYKTPVIGLITGLSEDMQVINETNEYLDNLHTGTCPTASVEFDLATKHPAEFFRMVEGLTSPANETYKIIDMDALSENTLDAIWLLENFKTPYQALDFNKALITLKPDKNAIIRARIQNNYRDKGERSIIDVLMQSTMMQLGSQQTYNSLTDKRAPNALTEENSGLIDFEKTYVESVMENKNTTSVIYQEVDATGRLVGYLKSPSEIKKDLLDTLEMGHNVIIGYTWPEPENDNRLAGHEITIIGTKKAQNGELIFICQDSDDNIDKPIEISESFLLTHIHHAGLPESIASREATYEDSWKINMQEYQKTKNN